MIGQLILSAMWLFLPAYIGNTMPVIVAKVPALKKWNTPVDLGKKWRGKPLLGSHKTYRGFVTGVASAIALAFYQRSVYHTEFVQGIALFDYTTVSPVLLGFLLGFGALFGDSVKSLIKRQCGVKSGAAFPPWDQIDYTLGAALFLLPVFVVSWKLLLVLLVLNSGLHLAVNTLGYVLGIKDVWY